MKFISMRPITEKKEDKLNREKFIKHFISILKKDINESRIIQFDGKWGTGKTSILNLVKKDLIKEDNYLYITFEPWLISSEYKLQFTFFNQLKKELELQDGEKYSNLICLLSEMAEWVTNNAQYFGAVDQRVFLLTSLLNILNINLRNRIKQIEAEKSDFDKLAELKKEISKYLSDSSIKLIIVIDDVDRLSNKQILEVLMLLKTVANFDNSIYIIPADYETIYKAIENELNRENGIDYVGKIFDTVIEVPKSNPEILKSLLIDDINSIIKDVRITEEKNHDRKMQNVFIEILENDYLTIRKINQYINNFQMIARDKYTIVNLYELMILEYIKLFFPKIFKIMISSKKMLTFSKEHIVGNERDAFGDAYITNSQLISIIEEKRNKLDDNEKDIFSILLGGMFYNLGYEKSKVRPSDKPGRKSKSIQYPEYYDRYFSGLTDQDVLFEDVLNEIEKIEDSKSFVELFKKYISQKNLLYFIYEFEAIDNIYELMDSEKLKNLLEATFIINYNEDLPNKPRGFLEYDDKTKLLYMGMRIFYRYLNKSQEENEKFALDFIKGFEINERLDMVRLLEGKKYLFSNFDNIYTNLIKNEFNKLSDDVLKGKPRFIRLMYELEKINHERAKKLILDYMSNAKGKNIYNYFKQIVGTRSDLLNGDVTEYIDTNTLKKTFELTDANIEELLNKMTKKQREEIKNLIDNSREND